MSHHALAVRRCMTSWLSAGGPTKVGPCETTSFASGSFRVRFASVSVFLRGNHMPRSEHRNEPREGVWEHVSMHWTRPSEPRSELATLIALCCWTGRAAESDTRKSLRYCSMARETGGFYETCFRCLTVRTAIAVPKVNHRRTHCTLSRQPAPLS